MFEFILACFILVMSFYLLAILCEDFFVPSLDTISKKFNWPSDVVGATFMAAGSSAPEFFTSFFGIFRSGGGGIGVGTIVGSAIFNILIITGCSLWVKRAHLTWQPITRDIFFYVIAIFALLAVFYDGVITWFEGLAFILLYGVYILAVLHWKKWFPYEDVNPIPILEEGLDKSTFNQFSKRFLGFFMPDPMKKPHLYWVTFWTSTLLLAVLSFGLVESAILISKYLHIDPTLFALTVLAGGTSIPDLISSVIVAKQGRADMAVTNALGSNIFDILFCLGIPWFLYTLLYSGSISVQNDSLEKSIGILLAIVIGVLFFFLIRKWTVGKKTGLIFILAYISYIIYLVYPLI